MPQSCGQKVQAQAAGCATRAYTWVGMQDCCWCTTEQLCGLLQAAYKLGLMARCRRQLKAAAERTKPRQTRSLPGAPAHVWRRVCLPVGQAEEAPNWQQALLLQNGLTTEWRASEVLAYPRATSHPGSRTHSPGRTAAPPRPDAVKQACDAVKGAHRQGPQTGNSWDRSHCRAGRALRASGPLRTLCHVPAGAACHE